MRRRAQVNWGREKAETDEQEWEATLGRKLWMVLELVPRAKAFHQEPRL